MYVNCGVYMSIVGNLYEYISLLRTVSKYRVCVCYSVIHSNTFTHIYAEQKKLYTCYTYSIDSCALYIILIYKRTKYPRERKITRTYESVRMNIYVRARVSNQVSGLYACIYMCGWVCVGMHCYQARILSFAHIAYI